MPKLPTPKIVQAPPFAPYWQTNDGQRVRLYLGDVRAVLAKLPASSVHIVVTSPPYWGLRDYGTGQWEGGREDCDHKAPPKGGLTSGTTSTLGPKRDGLKPTNSFFVESQSTQFKDICKKCGAKRVDQQLGSEPSPDCGTQGKAQCGRCFVCNLVAVFRGVRRVLRDDGTLWLNLGSSYGSDGQMVATPWLVALALQADGWILRQDIIWSKPSPMPESVKNRCTKAHEYIFLFSKKQGYFYDAEAIKEGADPASESRYKSTFNTGSKETAGRGLPEGVLDDTPGNRAFDGTRNKRSVWTVSSQGYPGAHFATFPLRLIEPCILAGTSEKGCCGACGAPWKRVVEETKLTRERPNKYTKRVPGMEGNGSIMPNDCAGVETRTVGWEPGCKCLSEEDLAIADSLGAPVTVPCTVLDPFFGAGTTGVVCLDKGRSVVGVDLSEKYLKENAIPRIEGVCLARPALVSLVRKERKGAIVGKRLS